MLLARPGAVRATANRPAAAPAPRRVQRVARPSARVGAGAADRAASEPHLQLATARLPPSVDQARFTDALYQWAATLTQSGANFPFALPLKADRLPTGFQISLLKRAKAGGFGSAGDIVATVEGAEGAGDVLMVRFFEGPTAQDGRSTPPPADTTERLEIVLKSLVDVDTIMGTMPSAIRTAVVAASQ